MLYASFKASFYNLGKEEVIFKNFFLNNYFI